MSEITYKESRLLALRWISALFARELTPEDVESYRNGEGKRLIALLRKALPDAVELDSIHKFLNSGQTPEATALDLAGAYSWLFHGVGGPKSAPPHQHDWSEQSDGTQMQCIAQCLELMSKCDLGPSKQTDEPVDHVSTQLEFLGYLEEKSASHPDGPWSEYRDSLIRAHLDEWLPLFLTACERNDRHGFYAAVANLTRWLLQDVLTDGSVRKLTANIG